MICSSAANKGRNFLRWHMQQFAIEVLTDTVPVWPRSAWVHCDYRHAVGQSQSEVPLQSLSSPAMKARRLHPTNGMDDRMVLHTCHVVSQQITTASVWGDQIRYL